MLICNGPFTRRASMDNYSKKSLKEQHNEQHCANVEPVCSLKVKHGIYKGIPFCSLIQDHMSWGASVEKNKNVNFKLFTYNDTEKVTVELKRPFKPIKQIPLKMVDCGVFESRVTADLAQHGDRYRFLLERKGHKPIRVRDPYSMMQDGYLGWSVIYDHNKYKWTDEKWMSNKNHSKVSRRANKENGLAPVGNLKIYELNIATLTDEGSFESAKKQFEKIAKDKHFNAVEIMPVENTYGINWGYDGVDKFAPSHVLGTPDKLKELVDYAHKLNLNVIMDIVPNHLGPDTAELQVTGPYIDGKNEFGYKFNFEKPNSKYVREYVINTGLNWLTNYHCDGLRVDMTKFMNSDFTMKQMIAEYNHHVPDAFIIAEDGRDNDPRITRPLSNNEKYENEHEHCLFIDKIESNKVSLNNLGFDSEWDFLYHKQIASMILGKWDGRVRNILNLDYSIGHSGQRVKYIMSHDEIGNIDGTRLIPKIIQNDLALTKCVIGSGEVDKLQKAAHASQSIVNAYLGGSLDSMNQQELDTFLKDNNIDKSLSFEEIKNAYEKALMQHRLALGKTYSIPGPKMVFQGDEEANNSYFKFFRKFSTGYEKYLEAKGYPPGDHAFEDSKLNSVKYSKDNERYLKQTESYSRDLNDIMDANPAMQNGTIMKTIVHPVSSVHAMYCKKEHNEIFSISNFSKESYKGNYFIDLPKGKWKEISNTDNKKYGGDGIFINDIVSSDGTNKVPIALPKYGMVFFKKVGN